jgi:hypothetical protein
MSVTALVSSRYHCIGIHKATISTDHSKRRAHLMAAGLSLASTPAIPSKYVTLRDMGSLKSAY